jgi:hypothetical protein
LLAIDALMNLIGLVPEAPAVVPGLFFSFFFLFPFFEADESDGLIAETSAVVARLSPHASYTSSLRPHTLVLKVSDTSSLKSHTLVA